MHHESTIVAATCVRDFFEEAVTAALRQHQVEAGEPVRAYVVDLLCDYTALPDRSPMDQPLALLMARSERALPAKRVGQLKEVGDRALYIAGFFSESLARRDLDIGYYSTIGGTAYRRLSALLEPRRRTSRVAEVYAELARLFEDLVAVLSLVRDHGRGHLDLARAFELFARTGSAAAARRLRQEGLLPLRGGPRGAPN